MDFRILGTLEAREGEHPVAVGGTKQRALLALLLLRELGMDVRERQAADLLARL